MLESGWSLEYGVQNLAGDSSVLNSGKSIISTTVVRA